MQGSINFDGSLVGNITGGGGGGGSEVVITPVLTSGTKIATINVNGVDYDIYSTDYSGDISSLQTGLSTANSNITALQGRMTTAEGNITTLQSDMSAAESIIGDGQLDIGNDLTDAVNEINQSLSQLQGLTVYKDLIPQTSYADFDDGSGLNIISLISNFDYSQNGTPSPSNPIPIIGNNSINIVVSPNSDFSGGTTYTINFIYNGNPLKIYKGYIDVISGVITLTHIEIDLGDIKWTNRGNGYFISENIGSKNKDNTIIADALCTNYEITNANKLSTIYPALAIGWNNNAVVDIRDTDYTNYTGAQFQSAMAGVKLVYELENPQILRIAGLQIITLIGQNYINSDIGDITNVKYLCTINFS